jgi:hypothetical protein
LGLRSLLFISLLSPIWLPPIFANVGYHLLAGEQAFFTYIYDSQVTNNTSDFENIDNLELVDWTYEK